MPDKSKVSAAKSGKMTNSPISKPDKKAETFRPVAVLRSGNAAQAAPGANQQLRTFEAASKLFLLR